MPELIQGRPQALPTVLTSTAPIKGSDVNLQASAIGGIAQAGLQLYKQDVKSEAEKGFKEALEQYASDKQAGVKYHSLEDVANLSPELAETKKELQAISNASKQGISNKDLLKLRSEAVMKKAIRRSPGLRKELATIAHDILGGDPSGAMVDLLLRDKEMEDPMQRYANSLSDQLVGSMVPVPHTQEGKVDIPQAELLLTALRQSERNDKLLKEVKRPDASREMDIATKYARSYKRQLDLRARPLVDSISAIRSQVKTFDQMKQMPELSAQLRDLKGALEADARTHFNSFTLEYGAENSAKFAALEQETITGLTAGIEAILNSENETQFEAASKLYDVLQDNFKLTFSETNEYAARIIASMPGAMMQNFSTVLSTDFDAQEVFGLLISEAVRSQDPAVIRKASMDNLLASLENNDAFLKMSEEDRKDVARKSSKLLFQTLNNPRFKLEENPSTYANAFAAIAQTLNPNSGKDVDNLIPLLTHNKVPEMINALIADGTEQGLISSEIVADSVTLSLAKWMKGHGVGRLGQLDRTTILGVSYNTEAAKFTLDRQESRSPQYRERNKELKTLIKNLNHSIDTLEDLKEHDPSIAHLDRAQIGQVLLYIPLRKAGINITGDPVKLPVEEKEVETEESITFKGLTEDAIQQIKQLAEELRGGAL